jgi:hypothetical protein
MSQSVRDVNSVKINQFNSAHAHVPIPLNPSQEATLKHTLRPIFEALIQNPLFKQTFANELHSDTDQIPLNITLTEKTITVINKKTQISSTFTIGQDPSYEPLHKIIISVFELANKTLSARKDLTSVLDHPSAKIATQTEEESVAEPLHSKRIPEELDLLDVSLISDVFTTPKTTEKDPFSDLYMPSFDPHPIPLHPRPRKEPLDSILTLYDTSPLELPPRFHLNQDATARSKRPYLEDLFYDLDDNSSKVEVPSPQKKSSFFDIDAF